MSRKNAREKDKKLTNGGKLSTSAFFVRRSIETSLSVRALINLVRSILPHSIARAKSLSISVMKGYE